MGLCKVGGCATSMLADLAHGATHAGNLNAGSLGGHPVRVLVPSNLRAQALPCLIPSTPGLCLYCSYARPGLLLTQNCSSPACARDSQKNAVGSRPEIAAKRFSLPGTQHHTGSQQQSGDQHTWGVIAPVLHSCKIVCNRLVAFCTSEDIWRSASLPCMQVAAVRSCRPCL